MLKKIELVVQILTPLHIGTGRTLVRDFDYVARGDRTFRLKEDGLVEVLYARDPKLTEQLMRTPPGQFLRPEDLREGSPFVRYVLPGEPKGKEFREQIKDAHDRPYLPGSSLKGALRTVLAWHGWKELGLSLRDLDPRVERAKFAARAPERKIFGNDPHHDLLRALRIADSVPVPITVRSLGIYVVQVWTKRGPAAPISVEAVQPETPFSLEATVDEKLFSDWSRQAPGFPLPHRNWLEGLPKIARDRATERRKKESDIWTSWGCAENPYDPLERLIQLKSAEEEKGFPLQLGFGTGWEGTTIGAPLKQDPEWTKVFQRFGLGKVPGKKGVTVPPDAFPSSRRVIAHEVGNRTHLTPLGWVWVQWKEQG